VAGAAETLVDAVRQALPVGVKRRARRALGLSSYRAVDADWHRRTIGNVHLWDELGKLQLDYLVGEGLEPGHYLLDVGCGPLRAGVHFIAYLEPGHYFGVDKNARMLERAREVELPRYGIGDRRPTLAAIDDFGFDRLGRQFDFAIAQSVFTHLPLNSIMRCLMEMERALVVGGRFYASFFENPDGKRNLGDVHQTDGIVTHFDSDFFHYDFDTFAWICDGTKLRADYVGDWGHPNNQKLLRFTREP